MCEIILLLNSPCFGISDFNLMLIETKTKKERKKWNFKNSKVHAFLSYERFMFSVFFVPLLLSKELYFNRTTRTVEQMSKDG